MHFYILHGIENILKILWLFPELNNEKGVFSEFFRNMNKVFKLI